MGAFEPSQQVFISGEVVETLEQEGRLVAGIAFKGGHFFVPLDTIPEAHLGDHVLMKATITVQRVESTDNDTATTVHSNKKNQP